MPRDRPSPRANAPGPSAPASLQVRCRGAAAIRHRTCPRSRRPRSSARRRIHRPRKNARRCPGCWCRARGSPDPWLRLILTHPERPVGGLDLVADAPADDECTGECCIGEVDRNRIVEHAARLRPPRMTVLREAAVPRPPLARGRSGRWRARTREMPARRSAIRTLFRDADPGDQGTRRPAFHRRSRSVTAVSSTCAPRRSG